ncbi:anti-sigma factor family protein [Cellulomonas taurus]|uniref:anti-sigma factor family protein n=1 Tax=Cellulomonas taurus TaxID=2729175 RepID=UPI00145F154C|nr:zf-HC2 domain-containing protein [Cellulomonas taurus]
MSAHLGDLVSAVVDGQLSPAANERALSHVAGCQRCATELADARRARQLMAQVCDVRPDGDLTARLLALGCAPGGFAPPSSPRPEAAPARRVSTSTHRALTGEIAPPRRGLRVLVGSVTGVGVVAVGLFVLGGRPVAVTPSAQPQEALSLLGQTEVAATTVSAASTEGSSTEEYLRWIRQSGWTSPTEIPAGWSVTSVRLQDGGETLRVGLSGPLGELVVTEQHGQLDAAALVGADQLTLDDRTVYLLSRAPWHLAWQDGDTVVEVVSADDGASATEVVSAFPGNGYDDGVPARLTRGWDTLAAAVSLP